MKILKKIQGPISLLLLFAMLVGGIGALAFHVTNRSNASLFPVEPALQKALLTTPVRVAATSLSPPAPAKPKSSLVSISTTNLIVTKCTDPAAVAAVPVTEKAL